MNRRPLGLAALVLGVLGIGAGWLAAQEQYSSTLNQLGSYFGSGRASFRCWSASPSSSWGSFYSFLGALLLKFFELYRAGLSDVEVITYDDLFRKVEILAELFGLKRAAESA